MKKAGFSFLILFCFSFLNVEASHIFGGHIHYTYLSTNTYILTLTLYRDCAGTSIADTAIIRASSLTGCGSLQQFKLPRTFSGLYISSCPGFPSVCQSGIFPGIEVEKFEDTVTFPANCNDWMLYYDNCCRSNYAGNLQNPSSSSFFIHAKLNALIVNSSPVFDTVDRWWFCVGVQDSMNLNCFDPDGDSLAFTWANPLNGPGPLGSNISYQAPFTATNPINGTETLDLVSGTLGFFSGTPQTFVVAMTIFEYRMGIMIGFVVKDMQFTIDSCSPCQIPLAKTIQSEGELAFSVFPNPVNEALYFTWTEVPKAATIYVYSMDGRKLRQEELGSILDVSDLHEGMYFIRIVDAQGREGTQKIAVLR